MAKLCNCFFRVTYHNAVAVFYRNFGNQTDHRSAHKHDFTALFEFYRDVFRSPCGVPDTADADYVAVSVPRYIFDDLKANLTRPSIGQKRRQKRMRKPDKVQFPLFQKLPFLVVNGRLDK